MTDLGRSEVDRPEVVRAVAEQFSAYESALVAGDVPRLTEFFRSGPDVVRFGVAEEQWGSEQLAAFRLANPSVPPGRSLRETRINTFGLDTAVVSTLFSYPDSDRLGRQSQFWRLMDGQWRIVHAHVSER